MTLTSPTFRALTIAAAILTTAITAALWNRAGGRRSTKLLCRLGLLILSDVMTAIAVLVSINIAYGGLIATWGDLFDNLRPGPSHVARPIDRGPPGERQARVNAGAGEHRTALPPRPTTGHSPSGQ